MGHKPDMSVANEHAVALEAECLSKALGGRGLFASLGFQVSGGEALVVRGANGSGKTTLLRAVAGLLDADSGTISMRHGMDLLDHGDAIGHMHYLGHDNALKSAQSVRANLTFWRDFLTAVGSRDDLQRAAETLDIAHLLDLPVAALSTGQKRRTGFARLLLARRPIWLMDEPTAALDAKSSALIEQLVASHLDGGGLVIAATHLPFLDGRSITLSMDNFAASGSASADGVEW